MPQISARIPEELDDEIRERIEKRDESLAAVVRTLLERGIEYDELQQKCERLENEKQQLIADREERHELRAYVEEEKSMVKRLDEREERREQREDRRERRLQAPIWKRGWWKIAGTPRESED